MLNACHQGIIVAAVLAAGAEVVTAGPPTVIHVDDSADLGGDGSTWDTAFDSLQEALADAATLTPPVEVRVAGGTYLPSAGDENASFELLDDVTLIGGFAGLANPPGTRDVRDLVAFESILSGDLGNNNFSNNILESNTPGDTEIDGFTISDADGSSGSEGAGMLVGNGGRTTVRSCRFLNNSDNNEGGAVWADADMLFIHCHFDGNTASNRGGAIYWTANNGILTAVNCRFANNSTNQAGGAIWANDGILRLYNTTFLSNNANTGGGGSSGGGAIYADVDVQLELVNCTLTDNSGNGGAIKLRSSSSLDMRNSIAQGNPNGAVSGGNDTIRYSNVQNEADPDTGNIDEPPLFVDAMNGDLRLQPGSPCIDAGDNAAVPTDDEDLDGDGDISEPLPWDLDEATRFVDDPFTPDSGAGTRPIVDMGAYELPLPAGFNIFTGAAGGSWFDADNWSGGVPDAASSVLIATDVLVDMPGAVAGTVQVLAGGNLDLRSNGTLSADELMMDPAGTLTIEIAGPPGGVAWGMVDVTGTATLAGTLLIEAPMYVPALGDVYDVLSAGAITGQFDEIPTIVLPGRFGLVTVGPDAVTVMFGEAALYVDDNAAPGGDGLAWSTAYKHLQDALSTAQTLVAVTALEIRVGQGTYRPDRDEANEGGTGIRTASFSLITGVTTLGGYAGPGTPDPDARDVEQYESILSGDLASDNSYHVVDASEPGVSILDGFTITEGHANGSFAAGDGAGIFIDGSAPVIRHCRISMNTADDEGAGVLVRSADAAPVFVSCCFYENHAGLTGGGIEIESGHATIVNCDLIANHADVLGGGLDMDGGSLVLASCRVLGNTCLDIGGAGVDVDDAEIMNCEFSGNVGGDAGAIATQGSATISNSTFANNTGSEGGAILCRFSSDVVVRNCIVWDNMSATGAAVHVKESSDLLFERCLLVDDFLGILTLVPGTNILDENPFFADADGPDDIVGTDDDDLHLNSGSSAVDAGDNALIAVDVADVDEDGDDMEPVPLDVLGDNRRQDDPDTPDTGPGTPPIVNIGARETTLGVVARFIGGGMGDPLDWADPANWNNGFVPGVDDNVVIEASVMISGSITVRGIAVRAGVTMTIMSDGTLQTQSLVLDAGGSLLVRIADTSGSGNFGSILVSGTALLHGDLAIEIDGGFLPFPGESYQLLSAGAVSGSLGSVSLPDVDPFVADLIQSPTTLELQILQVIVFVDATADPGGDGLRWQTAHRFLQDGLAASSGGGSITEVRISQGRHRPDQSESNPDGTGSESSHFQLLDGVTLRGGYAGLAGVNPDEHDASRFATILWGDLTGNTEEPPTFGFPSCKHVVLGGGTDATAVLEAVTVAGGDADATPPTDDDSGGGIWIADGSPTIRECIIRNNHARVNGGGLRSNGSSSPMFVDCVFTLNVAESGGGAALVTDGAATFDGCTFTLNSAINGGAVANWFNAPNYVGCEFDQNSASSGGACWNASASPLFDGCMFVNNEATGSVGGGAIRSGASDGTFPADPEIVDCVFLDNEAAMGKGGACASYSGSLEIRDCSFTGNSSGIDGGAIAAAIGHDSTISACTFYQNTAGEDGGGAVWNGVGTTAVITGCRVIGNVAGDDGGGLQGETDANLQVTNCIFSGNACGSIGNARGGGMRYSDGAAGTLTQCTFTENSAEFGGGIYIESGGECCTHNCIFWNNHAGGTVESAQIASDGVPTVTHTVIQGLSILRGNGNTAVDPLLVDPAGGDTNVGTLDDDLRLDAGSSAIDAGDSNAIPPGTLLDLDGNLRRLDDPGVYPDTGVGFPVVDMGAYERQLPSGVVGYVGPIGGTWFDDDHWSSGATPDSSTAAVVTTSVLVDQAGAIVDDLTIAAGGSVQVIPGASLLATTIDVDPGGDLRVGLDAGGNPGLVTVTGTATLAGTLTLDFDPGWLPAVGDTIDVLTAQTINGVFDDVIMPELPSRFVRVVYGPTSVTIEIMPFVLHVNDDPGPGGDGFSWNQGLVHLQDALALTAARTQRDDLLIKVAQGFHFPDESSSSPAGSGDRDATFQLFSGVTLKGGYAGYGAPDPDEFHPDLLTVLDGDLDGDDQDGFLNIGENTLHVVTGDGVDATAVLSGFMIQHGNATSGRGGGLHVDTGSPTVEGCVFFRNHSDTDAGGVEVNSGAAVFIDCLFEQNRALEKGGGAEVRLGTASFLHCTFVENNAERGAGISNQQASSVLVRECWFERNEAVDDGVGGAVRNHFSSVNLVGCTMFDNVAATDGGAIRNWESNVSVVNCRFVGNEAGDDGGALSIRSNTQLSLVNCLFSGNMAADLGGAIEAGGNSAASAELCTVATNTANIAGGVLIESGIIAVRNCILWGNVDGGGNTDGSAQISGDGATASYTIIEGLVSQTDGNINADPRFVDPDGSDDVVGTSDDDLRLLPESPAIDSGNSNQLPADDLDVDDDGDDTEEIPDDLDGLDRRVDDEGTVDFGVGDDPIVDRGAYEFEGVDINDAVVRYWDGGGFTNDFDDTGNWRENLVAGGPHTAVFDTVFGPYTVDLSGADQAVNRLLVRRGEVTFDLAGSVLTVTEGTDDALVVGDRAGEFPEFIVTGGTVFGWTVRIGGGSGPGALRLYGADAQCIALFGLDVRDGEVAVGAGSSVSLAASDIRLFKRGVLSGEGLVMGDVSNVGEIMPGTDGAGALQLEGHYEQINFIEPPFEQSGSLRIEIGGTEPGAWDQLVVTGDATLAGGLFVAFVDLSGGNDPFEPEIPDAFTVLESTMMCDRFDVISVPRLPAGRFMRPTYDPGDGGTGMPASVTLVVEALSLDPDPTQSGQVPVSGTPTAVAINDLNGDGFDDIALTLAGIPESLLVLFNDGTGSGFSSHFETAGVGLSGITIANLDNQLDLDIAVTNAIDGTLSVYLSDGAEGYLPPQTLAVGNEPVDVAAGQFFGGDGHVDLAVVNASDDQVVLAVNDVNGAGTFALGGNGIDIPGRPFAVDPEDWDDDKCIDELVVVAMNAGTATLVESDDAGLVDTGIVIAVGAGPVDVDAADLDGMGGPDFFVTANEDGGTVSVVVQDASGDFAPAVDLPVGPEARSVALVDLDDDDDADIAVVSGTPGSSTVSMLRNDSVLDGGIVDVIFTEPRPIDEDNPILVAAGDLDEDLGTDDDLVVISEEGLPLEGGVAAGPQYVARIFGAEPCPGDTNGDAVVNVDDLNAIILDWGTDGSANGGDIAGPAGSPPDGVVNVNDLNAVILGWGACGGG